MSVIFEAPCRASRRPGDQQINVSAENRASRYGSMPIIAVLARECLRSRAPLPGRSNRCPERSVRLACRFFHPLIIGG